MRFAQIIEYKGFDFCGFQRQKDPKIKTIQQEIETALEKVCCQKIKIICAGRTDAKVHASYQVIHFDLNNSLRNLDNLTRGVNFFLPNTIKVIQTVKTKADFHARFDAISRSYTYVLLNSTRNLCFLNNLITYVYGNICVDKMQKASEILIGKHDFSSFRAKDCQAHTPIRTIEKLTIEKKNDFIYFKITANAFLQHMVRNIVGSLLYVGIEKKNLAWFTEVFLKKDREIAGPTAPPFGLYLTNVCYKEKLFLANEDFYLN